MKVIKYWKVQLLQLSQPSSIINARNLVETLLFEGFSKGKPYIKLGSGINIELCTAPDSLETRIFRDHLIDGVRCIPVCEGDDETDGTPGQDTKPPSRKSMIEYIKQAIGGGYSTRIPDLVENPGLLTFFHEEAINYEYRLCWRWCNRNLAAGIMQEYFPNGGRDWAQILSLFDAISAGKIPGVRTEDFIKD